MAVTHLVGINNKNMNSPRHIRRKLRQGVAYTQETWTVRGKYAGNLDRAWYIRRKLGPSESYTQVTWREAWHKRRKIDLSVRSNTQQSFHRAWHLRNKLGQQWHIHKKLGEYAAYTQETRRVRGI